MNFIMDEELLYDDDENDDEYNYDIGNDEEDELLNGDEDGEEADEDNKGTQQQENEDEKVNGREDDVLSLDLEEDDFKLCDEKSYEEESERPERCNKFVSEKGVTSNQNQAVRPRFTRNYCPEKRSSFHLNRQFNNFNNYNAFQNRRRFRGDFHSNRGRFFDRRHTSNKVYINKNYQGVVQVPENKSRLAWDRPKNCWENNQQPTQSWNVNRSIPNINPIPSIPSLFDCKPNISFPPPQNPSPKLHFEPPPPLPEPRNTYLMPPPLPEQRNTYLMPPPQQMHRNQTVFENTWSNSANNVPPMNYQGQTFQQMNYQPFVQEQHFNPMPHSQPVPVVHQNESHNTYGQNNFASTYKKIEVINPRQIYNKQINNMEYEDYDQHWQDFSVQNNDVESYNSFENQSNQNHFNYNENKNNGQSFNNWNVNRRPNIREVTPVTSPKKPRFSSPKVVDQQQYEIEEDEETKKYRLQIEEQKKKRQQVLEMKEKRRKEAMQQEQMSKQNNQEQKLATTQTLSKLTFPTENNIAPKAISNLQAQKLDYIKKEPNTQWEQKPSIIKIRTDNPPAIKTEVDDSLSVPNTFMANRIVLVKSKNSANNMNSLNLQTAANRMSKSNNFSTLLKSEPIDTNTKFEENNQTTGSVQKATTSQSTFLNSRKILTKTSYNSKSISNNNNTSNHLLNTRVALVSNLSSSTTQNKLLEMAREIGDIQNLRLDAQERQATILFKTVASAHAFFQKFHRTMLDLSIIQVKLDKML